MTDIPHSVWRAVEWIPRQRGPYTACTCDRCKAERDRANNADAARTARGAS